LPRENITIKAANHDIREVNDFACGTKTRRGPSAALPGADVWRHAWWDGAHCHCAARHAVNDNISADFQFRVFYRNLKSGLALLFQMGGRGASSHAGRQKHDYF
jgi:hypothetical protein